MSLEADLCPDPKRGLLHVAKSFGLFRLGLAAQRRSSPLLILCYHGVSQSDEHQWNPELYMPPALFRRRLQTIHSLGFQIAELGSALQQFRAGTLKVPTVVLTFDDGWYDFYSQAWPVLREFSAPATVYQTTFYSNYNKPVFDVACSYLLWRGRGRILNDRFLTGGDEPVALTSRSILNRILVGLKERVRDLSYSAEEKDRVLRDLAAALGLDYGEIFRSRSLHLMNAKEIGEISKAGIDVQLHTHSHAMPLEKDQFLREIERNRFFVEISTGRPAFHFCYPNGWHRPELGGWLTEAGVQSATTCDPGLVRRSSSELYLPRLVDSCYVSEVRFESWLAGIGLLGASAKRRFSFAGSPGRPVALQARPRPVSKIPQHAVASGPKPEALSARAAGSRT